MSITVPAPTPSPPPPAERSGREAYRDLLKTLVAANERLVCLDSDTGLFTRADFPEATQRYVNVGIAEHTMMGAASGLAREGRMPVVNTMAAFASSRAIEAVKIDIALGNLPVRIVATHSGVSAGHLGPTHHALEDLAAMRVLPNMTVVVPADAEATEELFTQALGLPGPVYMRLGRHATAPVPVRGRLVLGQAQTLRWGGDITLAACGALPVLMAIEAADILSSQGISATVMNVHTVKPLDVPALAAAASITGTVITIEEHWQVGGFGSAVAEALSALSSARVLRMGMPDEFVPVAGSQEYLLARAGITAASIAERARTALNDSWRTS